MALCEVQGWPSVTRLTCSMPPATAPAPGGRRPVSYHVGGVWPHDTAIGIAGLARAGLRDEASTLAAALIEAAQHFAHRLPELFSGFDRRAFEFPVPYPTACSPRAWAAASTLLLLLLRVLVGMEPDPGSGCPHVRPLVPPHARPLRLEGVRTGSDQLSLLVEVDGAVHTDFTSASDRLGRKMNRGRRLTTPVRCREEG